jgi:8-oxo-dGTP pyrophosphatase MutT (NUDIX family)
MFRIARRDATMTKIIKDASFGAVVISAQKTILLIKQISQYGSYWALPKGHKENGETDEMTAIREVNEECGLSLTINHLVPGIWHKENYIFKGLQHYNGSAFRQIRQKKVYFDKEVKYGVALVDSELPITPQMNEIVEAGWFTFDEAMKKLKHKTQKETVRTLCESRLM